MNHSRRPDQNVQRHDRNQQATTSLRPLIILGISSAVVYGIIAWQSLRFDFHSETTQRPIIAGLLLFALAFAGYLLAIRLATRANQNSRLMWVIVGAAVVFRVTMLFSVPIQEVDIYRYMWDGEVATQGVSPFRFPPDQVLAADAGDSSDPKLQRLAILRDENDAIAEVLRRVHFGDLPTIYPPTSQAVFYCAALTTPSHASVSTRVRIMKAWLIGFDLGVLFLVIKLLRVCRLPVGLSLIYAWCPLVLKEVANSGHLDSIAVFLTTGAIYIVVRTLNRSENASDSRFGISCSLIFASIVLAAAVGAKLYPVVLAPLILFGVVRRFGWRKVLVPTIVFAAATMLLLWPILASKLKVSSAQTPQTAESRHAPPLPFETVPSAESQLAGYVASKSETARTLPDNDPSLGVTTFLKYWEMNDFIFMVLIENLKSTAIMPNGQSVWFSIVPESFRQPIINFVSSGLSVPVAETPFLFTRFVTTLVFITIALSLAWRAGNNRNITSFCKAGFLTLAWFWLLLPTQNPWYWLWALPLLPFVHNRAWLVVSGIVLVYYLRFWFDYHFEELAVLGTPYKGKVFFDFVVTWFEYAPWFVWLAIEYRKPRNMNEQMIAWLP